MKKKVFYILSFVLPVFIFLVISNLMGFNISDDSYYNDYPNLLILTINSFKKINYFFTFKYGLGVDLYNIKTLFSNSLLNMLFMFFSSKHVIDFIYYITVFRIGLMGVTMSIYLNSLSDDKYSYKTIIFSLLYALSGYVLTYSFSMMWMDSLVLLPLIILGIDKMIFSNKSYLYIIFMSLCLYSNYYSGITILFVCLFYLIYKCNISYCFNIKKLVRFIFSSLLCLGISSIVLLPAMYYLNFINNVDFVFNYDFVNSMLISNKLYLGIIVILLFFLYMFNNRYNKTDRLWTFLYMLLFYLSFNFIFEFIELPIPVTHIYSFSYIFFMIVIAYKCFINIDGINFSNKYMYILLLIVLGLFFVGNLKLVFILIRIILFIIYFFLIKYRCYNAILVFIIIELSINGGVILYGSNEYIDNNYIDEINYISSIDKSFYRTNIDINCDKYFCNNNVKVYLDNNDNLDNKLGVKYYIGDNDQYMILHDNIYYNDSYDDIIYGVSNDNDIIHFTNVKYNGYNYIYRGSISSNNDIKVVSTIPYYDSFEIYVDDNIVDYYIIDDAFIGFDVSSGDHRININYYPKGYKKGIIISVISFILFLCFIRWEQLFYKVNNKLK